MKNNNCDAKYGIIIIYVEYGIGETNLFHANAMSDITNSIAPIA